jgi:hypothetical protein
MSWFKQLFDDSNSINEKSVVGFFAFFLMCIAFMVDIITGYMGKELVINRMIFDGFMVIVLGSFAIGSADKYINRKNPTDKSENNKPDELG